MNGRPVIIGLLCLYSGKFSELFEMDLWAC